MWTICYETQTDVMREALWEALKDSLTGEPLGPNSDRLELHGPLAAGTRLTVTPKGQDLIESVITEVIDGQSYSDQTAYNGVLLTFRHELIGPTEHGTLIRYSLSISGDGADEHGLEIGPRITDDFPATIADLVSAARHP